jgi:hypothetical protein
MDGRMKASKRVPHMTVLDAIRHLQQVGMVLPFRKPMVIAVERALRG